MPLENTTINGASQRHPKTPRMTVFILSQYFRDPLAIKQKTVQTQKGFNGFGALRAVEFINTEALDGKGQPASPFLLGVGYMPMPTIRINMRRVKKPTALQYFEFKRFLVAVSIPHSL